MCGFRTRNKVKFVTGLVVAYDGEHDGVSDCGLASFGIGEGGGGISVITVFSMVEDEDASDGSVGGWTLPDSSSGELVLRNRAFRSPSKLGFPPNMDTPPTGRFKVGFGSFGGSVSF